MIYRIIFFTFGVACILGAPTDIASSDKQQPTVIPIVSQSEELELNGTYKFSYETGNGIKREETSYDKVLPKTSSRSHSSEEGEESDDSDESNEIHVQQGSYSYTAPDGTLITVRYIADENGFRPVGSHLPRVPTAISPNSNEKSGRTLKQPDSASSESAQSVNVKSISDEFVSTVASSSAAQLTPTEEKQIETMSDVTSTDKEPKTTQKISSSAKTSNLVTTKPSQSEPKTESTESTVTTSTQANEISESASGPGSTPEVSEKSEDISKQPDSAPFESVPPVDVNSASEKTVPVITSRSAAQPKPAEDKPSENTSVATPKDEEPNTSETTPSSDKTLDIVTTTAYQSEPKTEATESTISTSTHPNEISESESGSGSTPEGKTDSSEEKIETSTQAATDEQPSVTTDTTKSPPSNEKTTEFSNAETTSATTLSDGTNTEVDITATTATLDKDEATKSESAEAVTQEAIELSSSTEAPSSEEPLVNTSGFSLTVRIIKDYVTTYFNIIIKM